MQSICHFICIICIICIWIQYATSGILYTWTRRYILVQTRTYLSQYQLRPFWTDWYVPVCTDAGNSSYSTYVSVPVCTALVQGGTRRYKEVPSGTKEVQGGTKRYQNGSEQYRQVHTGTYWSDVKQYVPVHTGTYCFVLIFLLNQVMLSYWIPCYNATLLEVLYSRLMQAQARSWFN